jgi:hypothetical protein
MCFVSLFSSSFSHSPLHLIFAFLPLLLFSWPGAGQLAPPQPTAAFNVKDPAGGVTVLHGLLFHQFRLFARPACFHSIS